MKDGLIDRRSSVELVSFHIACVDRSVDRSVGLDRSVDRSVGLDRSVDRSVDRSIGLDRSVDRSVDRSIGLDRSVSIFHRSVDRGRESSFAAAIERARARQRASR